MRVVPLDRFVASLLAIVSWLHATVQVSRVSGMPWSGWPPGPRRGQIGRLAIGHDARRHLGRLSASLATLDELKGFRPPDECPQTIISSQRIPHMTTASNAAVGFIGCDVGKTTIVVFDSRDGRTTDVPNRRQDLARFA